MIKVMPANDKEETLSELESLSSEKPLFLSNIIKDEEREEFEYNEEDNDFAKSIEESKTYDDFDYEYDYKNDYYDEDYEPTEEEEYEEEFNELMGSLVPLAGAPKEYVINETGEVLIGNDDPTRHYLTSMEDDYENSEGDSGEEFVNRIVDPNRKAYKKLLKERNVFKRMYAEELTLAYDLYKETDQFSRELAKKYSEITKFSSNRSRGSASVSKYLVDLADAVLSSKQTKLNIIKEISGIKKTSAELKMKFDERMYKLQQQAAKENREDNVDPELHASQFMSNLINIVGRNNLRDTVTGSTEESINSYDYENNYNDENYNDRDSNDYREDYPSDDYLDSVISNRLNNYNERSIYGDNNIVNEKKDVSVKIKRDTRTGEYSYFAEDKDGNIIENYDLPKVDEREFPIRFSNDGKYADDKFGRTFKVVEI